MALNFDASTFGYSQEGLSQFIKNLKVDCIEAAANQIKSGVDGLKTEVDEAWKGDSANKFKKRVEEDADAVADAINDAGDDIVKALQGIGGKMVQIDEDLDF